METQTICFLKGLLKASISKGLISGFPINDQQSIVKEADSKRFLNNLIYMEYCPIMITDIYQSSVRISCTTCS